MRPESSFRPFAFITLSGIGHGLCVVGLGLLPIAGIIGSGISKQTIEMAEVSVETAPVVTPVATPVVHQAPTPAPKKKVAAAAPVKQSPKTTEPTEMKSEEQPEETVALAPDVSEDDLKPVPVKEQLPAGVAAASDSDTDTEAEAESTTQEETAPPAAATGAAATGAANEATPRSYLDLKQKPGNRSPEYPLEARRSGRQGNVEILYYVTSEGAVTQAKITKSSGSDDLDAEALRTISQYRFVPGQEGWTKHPVLYSLKGQSEQLPGRLRTMGATNNN